MKKLMLLTLAIIISLSLVACGGETAAPSDSTAVTDTAVDAVTLVDVTSDTGVSMKLPSDLTLLENKMYTNTSNGDNVVFKIQASSEAPLSTWTQDIVFAAYSDLTDATLESFENGIQINGSEALVSKVSYKTSAGIPAKSVFVVVTDDMNNYVVNFTYDDSAESSLAANIQTCIDSITLAAA